MCEPAGQFKMPFIILFVALFTLSLKGADGQEIVLGPLKNTSPCSQGLRSGIDNFTFTGTVGRNYNALVQSFWSKLITIQISDSSSSFTKMCDIYIGEDGFFCDPLLTDRCYCDHFDNATSSAHFIVNYTAQSDYSQRIIRAQWKNTNGAVIYSINTTTVPAIYGVNNANLTLTVNGAPARQTSAPFGVHFESNKSNTVQLCCLNTASPCYPRMSFNGQVFDDQPNCLNHTVFVANVNYKANVTLAYSVCTKSDYITVGSGVITTNEEANVGTTTLVSPATGTAATTLRTSTSTGMRFEQADHTNLLTKFGPGLLIAGLSFVLTGFYLIWISEGAFFSHKPTVASVDTTNVGEIIDEPPEAETAIE